MPLQTQSLLECRRITPAESVLYRRSIYIRCACCGMDSDWAQQPWTVRTTTLRTKWNDRGLCDRHAQEAIDAGVPRRSALTLPPVEKIVDDEPDRKITVAERLLDVVRRSGGGSPDRIKSWAIANNVNVPRNLSLYRLRKSELTRDRIAVTTNGKVTEYYYKEDAQC